MLAVIAERVQVFVLLLRSPLGTRRLCRPIERRINLRLQASLTEICSRLVRIPLQLVKAFSRSGLPGQKGELILHFRTYPCVL